jgi:hypothetical protein
MIRDDLSTRLIHLTRGVTYNAAEAFLSIVESKMLRGDTGNIKGGYRCICFSEAPLSNLAMILANPMAHEMRYKPFGVMLDKKWLFARGGRPVIYQPASDFKLLHDSQRYRHVTYEPPDVDFTWEREWRICVDELPLDPAIATLIVPNRAWEKWFHDENQKSQFRFAAASRGATKSPRYPWHFVVLEDIGVDMPDDVPAPPSRE